MKFKLSKEEKNTIDMAEKYATLKELFMIVYWDMFKKEKLKKLHECIEKGMNWEFSFKEAKLLNNKKL